MITTFFNFIENKAYLLFVVFGFILFGFYPFYDAFFYKLHSLHIWRQADCLTLSATYNWFSNDFFEPRVLNLAYTGTGKTGSDFPLLYYALSFFTNSGYFETLYRTVNFLIAALGLFSFYALGKRFVPKHISAIATLFFLTSPTYVYYMNNYLMNMAALSLSIIAIHLGYIYFESNRKSFLLSGSLVFLVAILLKTTALVHLLVILISCFTLLLTDSTKKKQYKNILLSGFVVIGIVLCWVTYIKAYNANNIQGMFLTGILPIWDNDFAAIQTIFERINYRKRVLYNPYVIISFILFVLSIFAAFFFLKPSDKKTVFPLVIYSGGFGAYFLLFFTVLNEHDYYYINWLILVPIALITIYRLFGKKEKYARWITLALLIVLFDSVFVAKLRLDDRYTDWRNELYIQQIAPIESELVTNTSINWAITDKVFIPSDQTINASLYLLKVQGWTGYNLIDSKSKLEQIKAFGLKYIILKKQDIHPKFIQEEIDQSELIQSSLHFEVYLINTNG